MENYKQLNRIERIKCGNGNCFLIRGDSTGILIDTGRTKYREKILEACKDIEISLIILTHGHVDHIQNAAFLSQNLNAPIAMHSADKDLIKNNMLEPPSAEKLLGKVVLGLSIESFKNDYIEPFEPSLFLEEGDSLKPYGVDAKVIAIPGHTKGSIGIQVGTKDLIVGDALMNLFYPTVSMLYGDKQVMLASAAKIAEYGKVTIHFGHGKSVANKQWVKSEL